MDWLEEFGQGGYTQPFRVRPIRTIEVIPYQGLSQMKTGNGLAGCGPVPGISEGGKLDFICKVETRR
jgi:hypothetical protein